MGLVVLVLEVHRTLVAQRAVESLAVVKDFYPLEERCAGLGPSAKGLAVH